MSNRVGLWIDHQKAVIVSVTAQGESIQQIESGATHQEFRGPTRTKSPYAAQYGKGDDQLDKQFQQQLGRYYEKIIASLRGAGTVLIFGPGEARTEIKRRIEQEKSMRCEIHMEPADRMTDRQIAARVREFYDARPPSS
jgi:hypothetical protein